LTTDERLPDRVSSPPSIDRDPWERVEEWTEVAFEAPFVTVEAHNAVYERPSFRRRADDLMAPEIEESPRAVFTTGLSLDPPFPGGETPGSVFAVAAQYASREFRESLREDGLLAVEQTGSRELRLRGRRTAKAFQYDAAYPLAADPLEASRSPRLAVRVWAALWPTADAFDMAGGIYPLEDLASALDRDGGATPEVSIEARPGGDRREVFDCIRAAAE